MKRFIEIAMLCGTLIGLGACTTNVEDPEVDQSNTHDDDDDHTVCIEDCDDTKVTCVGECDDDSCEGSCVTEHDDCVQTCDDDGDDLPADAGS